MPRDGVLPGSVYEILSLYMNDVTQYREALLAFSGEDIFDQPQFPPIIDYVMATLPSPSKDPAARPATASMGGANHFLNRMAMKYRDGRASYLQRALLADTECRTVLPVGMHFHYLGAVLGLMSEEPGMPAPEMPKPPQRKSVSGTAHVLRHFSDSGRVIYRADEEGAYIVLSC
jgi:hypothetical protein